MRNVHLLCPLAFMFLVSRFTEVVTSGLVLKVIGYYVYFINLPTSRSSTNGWYSRDPQMHIVRTDAGLQEHLHPLHWLLHACISTMVRLRAPRACTTWRKKARVILFEHGFTRPGRRPAAHKHCRIYHVTSCFTNHNYLLRAPNKPMRYIYSYVNWGS